MLAPVGAGLLAKAAGLPALMCLNDQVRQQAGSYRYAHADISEFAWTYCRSALAREKHKP
jgi:hypothetical protein